MAMLRSTPLLRQLAPTTLRRSLSPTAALQCPYRAAPQQSRQAHAISNPTLANIEKRWEAMPPQEQADLWMSLRDRMKVDWNEMTLQEKKAAYWIAFGPHGPRRETPPGEGMKVLTYTIIGVGAGFAIFFFTHMFAKEGSQTLNKEWQEETNKYLKEQRVEPISGVSSEGYTGKGMVQSPPAAKK